jgi:hypothetical protein
VARVPDILYQGQPGTTDTDLYTVPSGYKATITGILATNTNTDAKHFSLHLVQNGDLVANDVVIVKMKTIYGTDSGGDEWKFEFPIPLNTVGDKISGIQETAECITVTIIGFVEAV